MAKPKYEAPTSQQDLVERQKKGWEPGTVVPGSTDESPLDAHGFVGVDPIYQNAANSVDRPMQATEGPEAKIFEANGQKDNTWEGDDEDAEPADEDDEGDKGTGRGQGSSTSSQTPSASTPTTSTPTTSQPNKQ